MMGSSYWVSADWGSRVETPTALAERFLGTIDTLRGLNPLLDRWSWGDRQELWETECESGSYPLDIIRPRMAHAIERNMGNGGDGDAPDPYYGYALLSQTESTPPGSRVHLHGSAGARPTGGSGVTAWTNRMDFDVDAEPDGSLMTFAFWRSVVLLLAETWEATWVEASPNDIRTAWSGRTFRCAWMSYVSPRFAPLVTTPDDAIVERRPNGGLFMAATTDIFKTANPHHMAAARAIEAALQPLNRLKFPIDEPYR